MAKIDLSKVAMLQMNGETAEVDMREDVCKPLWLHHDEPMARLGMRLYQGPTELTDDEAAEIRKIIAPWSWVARDAIEKQLAKK